MDSGRIVFRVHAIQRMFERGVAVQTVRDVLSHGETIEEYPDDEPYPSRLILGWANERPIHVVAAYDTTTETIYVITVYHPTADRWTADYRRRIKP